ncbi:MAG: GIY-YIG nuclease family protein [Gemmatimonadales bacterium]
MRDRSCFVYILASDSRVLYTGVTNDLHRRIYQHRSGVIDGFTKRYRVYKLVWWEPVREPRAAIAREKQIKRWGRRKHIAMIEAENPGWQDLAADWYASG